MTDQGNRLRPMNRRQFLQGAAAVGGVAALAAIASPVAAASTSTEPVFMAAAQATQLKDVPRNATLVTVRGGTQGKFTEDQLWNPFIATANHQTGAAVRVRAAGLLQRLPGQADHVAGRVVPVLARLQAADHQDAPRGDVERRCAVHGRRRRLHLQRAQRARLQGQVGRRRRPGARPGGRASIRRRSSSTSRARRRASSSTAPTSSTSAST